MPNPNEDPEMEHVLAPGRFTIKENDDVIEPNSDGTVNLDGTMGGTLGNARSR